MVHVDLSVIIISFNTKKLLRGCLDSVYETIKGLNMEVFVVDNASTDGSPEMVEALFPEVRLIRNMGNIGFAAANNIAISASKGRYILFLNSDVVLRDRAVINLIDHLESHQEAAAAGPKVLNNDGSLQFKGFSFPSFSFAATVLFGVERLFNEKLLYRFLPHLFWDKDLARVVDFVPGCCFLVRRSALDSVGLFSEEYFMYFEDADWCYRARKKGYEVWYLPAAEIVHIGSASPSVRRSELFANGMTLFYRKYTGLSKGIIIASLLTTATAIAYARAFIKPRFLSEADLIKDELRKYLLLLRGLIHKGSR